MFNKQPYIQKQDTPMGTGMWTNNNIMFMHFLETQYL